MSRRKGCRRRRLWSAWLEGECQRLAVRIRVLIDIEQIVVIQWEMSNEHRLNGVTRLMY